MLRQRPGFFEEELVDVRVAVEAFQRGADAGHIVSAVFQGVFNLLAHVAEFAHQGGVAAEVAQIAPDIRHAEEALGAFPHFLPVTEIVQQDLPVGGEGRKIGLHAVVGPILAFVVEEPAHLQPGGFRVSRFQRLEYLTAHAGQIVGFPTGRHQFVEDVNAVNVVSAVNLGFLLHELLLNLGIKFAHGIQEGAGIFVLIARPGFQLRERSVRVQAGELARNVACEGGQHRLHVQLPLAGGNLLLQLQLAVQPHLREGGKPAVDVLHAVPGQVGGTGEVIAYFFIREAHLGPNLVPDALLAGDGQRQVHAVQGHPVNEMLPIGPLPPGHGIAVSAVVQEEAVPYAGRCLHGFRNGRQFGRQGEAVAQQPAVFHVAVILEVMVQANGHGIGAVALDEQFGAALLQAEAVGIGLHALEDKVPGLFSRHAQGQVLGGFHLRILGLLRTGSRRQEGGGCE